jgi:hypothetical protein
VTEIVIFELLIFAQHIVEGFRTPHLFLQHLSTSRVNAFLGIIKKTFQTLIKNSENGKYEIPMDDLTTVANNYKQRSLISSLDSGILFIFHICNDDVEKFLKQSSKIRDAFPHSMSFEC